MNLSHCQVHTSSAESGLEQEQAAASCMIMLNDEKAKQIATKKEEMKKWKSKGEEKQKQKKKNERKTYD